MDYMPPSMPVRVACMDYMPPLCRYDIAKVSPVIWKTNVVKLTAVKQLNIASNLTNDALVASPMRLVWRMRLYSKERLLAPAKPLWLLPATLELKTGQCQRLV